MPAVTALDCPRKLEVERYTCSEASAAMKALVAELSAVRDTAICPGDFVSGQRDPYHANQLTRRVAC
jgi:hypothetical protein